MHRKGCCHEVLLSSDVFLLQQCDLCLPMLASSRSIREAGMDSSAVQCGEGMKGTDLG